MSGMLAVTEDGSSHRVRDDTTKWDDFEFLMLPQESISISLQIPPSRSRGEGRATQEHQNNHGCTKGHGENPEHKHKT